MIRPTYIVHAICMHACTHAGRLENTGIEKLASINDGTLLTTRSSDKSLCKHRRSKCLCLMSVMRTNARGKELILYRPCNTCEKISKFKFKAVF